MGKFTEKRFLPRHKAETEEKERLMNVIAARLSLEQDILFTYVHGSFINADSFRDIDIGIYTRVRKDFIFESELSHMLSRVTGLEVEVRVINKATVAFQMAVLRDGKLLFSADDDIRSDFIEKVGRRYRDYSHFRNIFMEAIGAGR
jgi:predicted nucleotidyltransferase